jgi:hypothetical protein
MDSSRLTTFGLVGLGLGNLAWTIANLVAGNLLNAGTDVVAAAGALVAAGGFAALLDGLPGTFRGGAFLLMAGLAGQHVTALATAFALPNSLSNLFALSGGLLIAYGAIAWKEEGWRPAAHWLGAGLVLVALEPIYFLVVAFGPVLQGGFMPGNLLIVLGCAAAVWGLRLSGLAADSAGPIGA